MPPKKNSMSATAIEELITQRVADALVHYEANQNRQNGNDNGNGRHDLGSGGGRTSHTARVCTYKEFLNCQPLNFIGTEGAIGLAHLFEKMEYVFHINNCTVKCQVKYVTCTLLGGALTWWNSHVRTVGYDAAYGMPWKSLMKMMTENYCPRSEIKKLETELWDLTVKGTDVESYTQRFQELVLLCSRMILDESDKVERYVGGLLDNNQGSVMASKPKILQEAIEFARSLMDQKVHVYAIRQADNKRRMDNNSKDNHAQQPPYKRQNVSRAYTVRPREKIEYARTLPLCNKCKFHHNGPCAAKCTNYKRVGHLTRDCWSPAATNNQRILTCFKCEIHGHCFSECPKLKNQNCRNQTGKW
ncbi:reverse transcriptase domain-containing protein [Tanacetum coccineum]